MILLLEKIIGLLIIFLGSFLVFYVNKHPSKVFKANDFRGYIAGSGFIIIGILIVIGKYHILDKFFQNYY